MANFQKKHREIALLGNLWTINLEIFQHTFVKYRDCERVNPGSYLGNIFNTFANMDKIVAINPGSFWA